MGTGKSALSFGHTQGAENTSGKISLPQNDSQIKHIFREKEGHLPTLLRIESYFEASLMTVQNLRVRIRMEIHGM